MRDGLRIFDADSHVVYPPDLWSSHLDARFCHRVGRRPPTGEEAYNPVTVDGRWTQHPTILYGQFNKVIGWTEADRAAKYGTEILDRGFPGDLTAAALAQEGVDLTVIYGPEFDLWTYGIDPELQAGMVRAYNRWGQEMWESSGGRVMVSGPIPLNDVRRAVEEIQHAYEHLDTRCFWARPDHFNGRNLGDRYYDPIWELLQDLDCAFGTHEFQGLNGVSVGSDRFRTYSEWHVVVHPHEAQMAIVSMICHGCSSGSPACAAPMEAGCGWLPSWLRRIDEHLEIAGAEFPEFTMSATEYFRRNCWISAECEDRFVADVIHWLGDEHIVFETDFPHPEAKFPHATETFLALEPDLISLESKQKILWDNAMNLYRFPEHLIPAELRDVPTGVDA